MLIYLSFPHDEILAKEVYETSCVVAARCIEAGYDVFNPVAHFQGAAVVMGARSLSFWMRKRLSFLCLCDAVVFLQYAGHDNSQTMNLERRYCLDSGIPFMEIPEEHIDEEICSVLGSLLMGSEGKKHQYLDEE